MSEGAGQMGETPRAERRRTVYRSAHVAALKERRWRRRQVLTLLAGVTLIALAGGFFVGSQWEHVSYRAAWLGDVLPFAPRLQAVADAHMRPIPKDDRLVVDKIRLDAPINEGAGSDTLRAGVWHQPNGATPPTQGNTVLAGHRLRGVFLLLDRLEPGDGIVVFWHRARHEYRVTSVTTSGPDDESILRCGSTAKLTLYTCVPRYEGNKRTVVVAEPVEAL